MAKEFKNFDTMFNRAEIVLCREKWLYNGSTSEDRNSYTQWPHIVQQWSNDRIRFAVYLAPDQLDWQLFRVSMKGLSTSEKLYMLDNRLDRLGDANTNDAWELEVCRIDNYIGALVRGGQLSSAPEYKVLK